MEATNTKRKGRSPRYPGIDLETAVERARKLWAEEAHYPTNVQVALSHWGYAPKSGGGAVAVAALKAFGLIEDQGSGDARKVQLTELAQDILLSESPGRRQEALQEAALRPPAHMDLWTHYGGFQLPSDTSVQLYLMRERGFTPGGSSELVSEYKRTIQFAGLTDRAASVISGTNGDDEDTDQSTELPMAEAVVVQKAGGTRSKVTAGGAVRAYIEIPIPLVGGGEARLSLPRNLTEEGWTQMQAVLAAMKPALVVPAGRDGDD
jgi:hypothetical protein